MQYQVGQIVEGEITGIQPYGAFVRFDENHYGLIHISEISRDYIKDIHQFLSMNQKIKVKILEMDSENGHYKLSLKALQPNLSKEKRRGYRGIKLPKMEIGFQTIEDNLDKWIAVEMRKEGESYD